MFDVTGFFLPLLSSTVIVATVAVILMMLKFLRVHNASISIKGNLFDVCPSLKIKMQML